MLKQISDRVRRWLPGRPGRPGRRAAVASFLVAILLVVLGAEWAVRTAGRAESLAVALRSSSLQAEAAMVEANPARVRLLSERLSGQAAAADALRRDLWPLRAAGAAVGWVPVLGENVTAAPRLADRLSSDLEAALRLLEAADALLALYDSMPADATGLASALSGLPGVEEIDAVAVLVASADAALARSEASAAGTRDGRLWGRLGREARDMRRQEERLRDFVDWAGLATGSLREMAALADAVDPLRGLLDGAGGSELTEAALEFMPPLETAAANASRTVSAANTAMPDSVSASNIGRTLRDLEPVLAALHDTARAGAITAEVITPALDEMEGSAGGLFGPDTRLLAAIDRLAAGRARLGEAERLLLRASERLTAASIKTSPAQAASETLSRLSSRLARAVSFLKDFPEIMPSALGRDGERRYLVMGETADELRASGGLVTGVWLLTFNHGEMTGTVYHDVVEFDDVDNLEAYPAPPGLLARHMDAPVWVLRDVGWEPEFPVVARTAAELWRLGPGEGEGVDGVIALTQWGMIRLAESLGTIDTGAEIVPAGELLSRLEAGTDRDGRLFMDTVFQSMLSQFNGPGVSGRLFALAQAASDVLIEKQLLVHLFDEELQPVVARAGWDGTIPRGDGDRLVVIDSNIGWSKVDRNIRRALSYDVSLQPNGLSRGTVTVTYENVSGPGASGCENQRMDAGLSYAQLKKACYWNLLRVYTADGARLDGAVALPLPENSVYARLGLGAPGDDTVNVEAGAAGTFISGLVVVPAGESRSASFELALPPSVLGWTGDTATYTLNLGAQPGTRGRPTRVRVELPPGLEYAGGSPRPARVNGRTLVFDFMLKEDTTLTLTMRPASAGDGDAASAAAAGAEGPATPGAR